MRNVCGLDCWLSLLFIMIEFLFWNFIWFLLFRSLFSVFIFSVPHWFINKWEIFFIASIIIRWFAVIMILDKKKPSWTDNIYEKGIFIEFLGKAYCHWTEGTGSKKETLTATEIYLDERQYLLGGRTGESH